MQPKLSWNFTKLIMVDYSRRYGQVTAMLNKYHNAVSNLSERKPAKLPFEHEIKLKDDIPVSSPPRRLPYSQRGEIERQMKSLLNKGFIEPLRSPYGSPIIPVVKPIIIHSPDLSTHSQHVDTVLTKLVERGLRVNYAKCEFFKPSVKFVGLLVSGDGICPPAFPITG